MPNKGMFSTLITGWIVVPSLVILLCAGSAGAQTRSADYTFVVAAGFLCDPGESGVCPAMAKSANGDAYQLSGAGTFSTQKQVRHRGRHVQPPVGRWGRA
jgi:hypothetical protein